jgi:hypothetical protein
MTLMCTSKNLSHAEGIRLGEEDNTRYQSIVGALQYLTLTQPDLFFLVKKVCQVLHATTMVHWMAMKRTLRYMHGRLELGITFTPDKSTLVKVFLDVDWTGCMDDRRSMGDED